MDLTLTEEQGALRATVEEFARKEVAPVIGELYERGEFPYEIVAKMGAMGLFGLPIAEEYGGMGGDYFALCLALEELARVDSSVAITLEAGVSLGAMPIYRFGTAEQRRRWLPELCTGERLAAFGLTEPGFGSDAGGATTRANHTLSTRLTELITVSRIASGPTQTLVAPPGYPAARPFRSARTSAASRSAAEALANSRTFFSASSALTLG